MKKMMNLCVLFAISSYIIRFIVDVVMYVFMKNDQSELYNDFWLLLVPELVATVLALGFYSLFLTKHFDTVFMRICTVVLIMVNLIFGILLYYDCKIGYVFYFAMIAVINFMNALYLKCNILPDKNKIGMKFVLVLLEMIEYGIMAVSVYAGFCAFPSLLIGSTIRYWQYYDVFTAMKFNVISEVVMVLAYVFCYMNNAEFLRDSTAEAKALKRAKSW